MSRIIARTISVIFVASTFALADCQRPADQTDHTSLRPSSATSAKVAMTPTATVSVAAATTETSMNAAGAASTTALPGDRASTSHYKIAIDYPVLSAQETPLAQALRETGAKAKQEFMGSLPDSKQFPEFADRQLQLLLDFKIAARNNDFVSVREQGMSDTGGAHPLPVDGTFVYDTRAQRVIGLDDLFTDPTAARKRLADFARAALTRKLMAQAPMPGEGSSEAIREWTANAKQMLDDGTQPTADNFSAFVVRATGNANDPSPGLTLIFSPYQVAAYVYGTLTVDVPTQVFGQYLKPQYRGAFTEIDRR